MKTRSALLSRKKSGWLALALGATLLGPNPALAQRKKANPASKVYISDVSGEAQIYTGEEILDLEKRSVYLAEGTIIDTRKPDREDARDKHFSTMVYSNGTGAFFDADTRVEINRFAQEPFAPNRSDVEVEPSISQTQAFVARGAVGLCNSKLVAGSNMTYQTPHGAVNIRGRKLVIEAQNNVTKISMLEGESTVRGGQLDLGGHNLLAGEQAIIRPGVAGQPNIVEIVRIPDSEMAGLDEKVTMACMAKRTVYFDVQEIQTGNGPAGNTPGATEGEGEAGGPVTAFDNDSTNTAQTVREIVPIPVVPTELPVQAAETPSRIGG